MSVTKKRKPKMQFSKKLCIMSWLLMCGVIGLDFCLRWSNRGSFNDVTVAIISFVTVFINGGYITQNIFRDNSANKYGVHIPTPGEKHYIDGGQHDTNKPTI